jgi:hypothetical protein
MPVTTEFENQEKTIKSVGYLDIEEAIKLWSMITSVSVVQPYK